MNDSASLGDTIRDRRLALGYSLGQLATKVNKTASSIRSWERGDEFPTDEESEALAAALDLDAELLASLRAPKQVWESDEIEEVNVHDPWQEDDEKGEPVAAAAVAADVAEPEADADEATAAAESTKAPKEEAAEDAAPEDAAPEDAASELVEEPESVEDLTEDRAPHDQAHPDEVQDDQAASADMDELFDAKTEAVPVVPAATVAVAQPKADPALATTQAQPVDTRSDNPVVAAWDDLRALYYRIFDPRRRWIYRVRFVLIVVAFFIMLRVLGWAVGNLWDAIGEVLDSISFSPGETPDVEN